MENNLELSRLEEFVDKLLDRYNILKKKYRALEDTLAKRDKEIQELKDTLHALQTERTEVGGKVARLIGRIEEWESSEEEISPVATTEEGGVQVSLFSSKTDS